jgi:hypothetical protein
MSFISYLESGYVLTISSGFLASTRFLETDSPPPETWLTRAERRCEGDDILYILFEYGNVKE